MALPKLTTPTYELEVPSTDEKVKYRPFLVKEEKILLMAMESGENKDIVQAVKDIVSECTFDKLDLGTMPMFDVEYIFLNIRSKSVGEISKLSLLCPDDKKTYAPVEVDLSKVKVQVGNDHTNKIELSEDMGMIMTYPTIDSFAETGIQTITASNMLEVIGGCVLQIYEEKGEKVYEAKDQTKKELTEFIESMNTTQFKQVQKFFDTMPKLKHEVTIKNPKTKKESKITLTGTKRFFRIALSHNSLENYMTTNFSLMQHHKYSLSELENMMPWEREIYVDMLVTHIKEENEKAKERQRNG